MAPAPNLSNIRVFINWHDQTVFAGEEVKCTITFKNVAPSPEQQRLRQQQQQQQQQQQHNNSQSDRHRLTSSLHSRAKASGSLSSSGKGHKRSALSLNVPPPSARSRSGSVQWSSARAAPEDRQGHSHKRSVSIISIGSAATTPVEEHSLRNENSSRSPRPTRGHSRAASLQLFPRGQGSPIPSPLSAATSPRYPNSLLYNASYPPDRFGRVPPTPTGSVPNSAGGPWRSPRRSPLSSPTPMPEFSFPAAPPPASSGLVSQNHNKTADESLLSPRSVRPDPSQFPLRPKDQPLSERPAARILSSTSLAGGTPRSSGEFYSISNNSSETLASDYPTQQPVKSPLRPSHLRRNSSMLGPQSTAPESLMMGYAQIQGSFSLDGSLISLAPFETVKKKAVVGGRGGGVVGLEPANQRDNGLLRSLGWGSFSTSFGDLIGKGELSTIKEMRGVANSKSVPLLNTPQSILFVDLQLAPGQSKVFEYSFRLPKGLPPTHKGKAIKVSYSLVIGTQRVGGAKEQQVRSVETPFRVLGGVNSVGEILGHDLMSPYVLLRDEAKVETRGEVTRTHKNKAPSRAPATMNEFLNYVDQLVARANENPRDSMLSPTAVPSSRRPSGIEEVSSSREAIDLAILRSNMTSEGQQSPNRFEIARNGSRVGVVMLTRPSYRLGEMITMVIDLVDTDIPCYAIHMSLETSEKIDASLAVRSESSIHRVTRKVYATSSDSTLYSRRVVFTPTIPISGTPEFITSGVSLEWKIRVEFVVPARDEGSIDPTTPKAHPLLEKISQDERGGLLLAAVENLACESFDVLVPLRVYGAIGTGLERLERDEASEEGLVV